ncbi:MAG: glucose-6-phosphate dehydrogenase [Candidatus Makana argininalis]
MSFKNIIKACDLVIFGTKGDLSFRKLFPSLYRLEKLNLIHEETKIIGVSRINWDIKYYIKSVKKSLKNFIKEPIDEKLWKKFSKRLKFCKLDINKTKYFKLLHNKLNQNKRKTINYFAMPPKTFGSICKGLGKAKLNNKKSYVVIEKPIGTNLSSSKIINNQVLKYFNDKQIYRIDHYLCKKVIINLLAFRFSNSIFISNWNNRYIDHVQITISEEIGIENRWNYFDQVGQLRDMVQSHMLQILTIITMSPPTNLTNDLIRNEKIKILRSLRPINYSNFKDTIVRGQYTSGFIKGKKVPGYIKETNANKNSLTETFVSIRVNIDNLIWSGVPFYLRTGKRLKTKYSEIVIYFKKPSISLFKKHFKKLNSNNKLTIRIQPNEGINIQILNNTTGLENIYNLYYNELNLKLNTKKNTSYIENDYDRIFLYLMRGMQNFFISQEEIEESWKWIDSIIEAWNMENDKPKPYKAGTWGPISSFNMIKKDNRIWNKYK